GGGREHALAWKCAQSPLVSTVYCAPGNAGTAAEAGVSNVEIGAEDLTALVEFAGREQIGLTIVGPEAPLVAGIVDVFEAAGLKCFGPPAAAAVLEASKSYTKDFLARHGIPSAAYAVFDELDAALAHIDERSAPMVVKADGLAAGKGVVVAASREEAREAARRMLGEHAFGAASSRIVIEDFLAGEEASFICMCDGLTAVPFASSQDHKARDDGDRGPNTGGMGAYSPAPVIDTELAEVIMRTVIEPTLTGMRDDGRPYRGFLYAGLMIGDDGIPRVLEYNCRFGDPETQPIMMRLRTDLVQACLDVLEGRAEQVHLDWDERAAVGVVIAAGGYPGDYAKGAIIEGLDHAAGAAKDSYVFHAGTRLVDGRCVTNGGRVLCAVGLGETVSAAQRTAYTRVDNIHFDGMFCRRDIGYRAVARERSQT
ncbi:MAG: phosphoribosylamine--glycine ligase, partial [Gammaproteobacteria bacterium]